MSILLIWTRIECAINIQNGVNKNAEIIEVMKNTKAIKRLLGGIEDFEDCKILHPQRP